jgi:hypothetical protein
LHRVLLRIARLCFARKARRGALVAACLLVPGGAGLGGEPGVRFSEIHYHPAEAAWLEFIEIHNGGEAPADLLGWSFSAGIRHAFTRSTVIPPGGFLVIARNAEALAAHHGLSRETLAGDFEGALDNGGERLALVDGAGRLVEEVTYRDGWPFDAAADGGGPSLQRLCFELPANAPFNWRAAPPSPGSGAPFHECPPAPVASSAAAFPVIINEIHYHPEGDPEPELEFIELHSRGETEADLSSWRFDRGIRFTFPQGTRLPAGGFLLVAQNPSLLAARFALPAAQVLGPFEEGTRLSNSGEGVRLVDRSGVLQDEVAYQDGDAWPAFADGLGGTLQRVDPFGPSGAPGNWRAAPPPPRDPGSREWMSFAIEGFHDGPRFYFYLLEAGEALIDDLRLEIADGDKTNLLANGDFSAGFDGWSGTGNHSTSMAQETGGYGDGGACALVRATGPGNGFQNGLRQTLAALPGATTRVVLSLRVKPLSGESRFIARSSLAQRENGLLFLEADAGGGSSATGGTPLAPNDAGGPGTPPTLRLLGTAPARPTSRDEVTVLARVEAHDAAAVEVLYQVGSGSPSAAALRDDGVPPDRLAGDGIWSGTIPPAPNNALVWFSLRAESSGGAVTLWPREKNPSPVIGYQVADVLPESNDDLRLFHIFTPGALNDLSCADGAYRAGNFVDHRGRAYREVGVKFRGETACNYPKRPIRVRFQKGDRFDGQKALNFNAGWNDKSMLREKFGFDFFRDAGVAYCETHLARVHTNGNVFHGAYFTIENPDERYLKRNRRRADGGFFKCRTAMLSGSTAGYEPRTDDSARKLPAVGAFATELNRLGGQALIDFINASMDVEGVIDYQAVQVIIIDGDSVVKNWLLYRGRHELEAGGPDLFTCFAWDIDLSYGQMLLTTDVRNYDIHPLFQTQTYPFHDQGYHGMLNALLQRAPGDFYVKAFYGRIWRLLEEKFNPAVLFPKLERFEAATGATVLDDLRKWPRTWGARGTDPEFWRRDFRTFVERRHAFLTAYLTANNPTTQGRRFQYTPAPRLKFTEIFYNPPGGSEALEFLEIANLEETSVALEGWSIPLIGYVFPPGAAVGGGEVFLVAKAPELWAGNPEAAAVPIFGPYPGELPNRGGVLRLRDSGEGGRYYPETIDVVVYEDGGSWPEGADGNGYALELAGLDLDNDEAGSWRAGWSPGRAAAANRAPLAVIEAEPGAGAAPLAVLLSALSSSDPDGDRLRYHWQLPGGGSDERPVLIYRFEESGEHRVVLTVSDPFGGESRAEIEISAGGREEELFRRGDANGDGRMDLSDAVFILGFLFIGGSAPGCMDAADVNDDQEVNIADAIFALSHLFTGGAAPPPPGARSCGSDETPDLLPPCRPDGTPCASARAGE